MEDQKSKNLWKYSTIALAVAILILVAGNFTGAFLFGNGVGEKSVKYLNEKIITGGGAQLVSVKEMSGLYNVTILYQNSSIPILTTKDGRFMILPNGAVVDTEEKEPEFAPQKSEKPEVSVFVMSFCPFGIQAENLMNPVHNLLGNKTDIKIKFIAEVYDSDAELNDYIASIKKNYPTVTDAQLASMKDKMLKLALEGKNVYISSLHGAIEATEDLRQLCIMKNYGGAIFWKYLMAFNSQCSKKYTNSTDYEPCWKTAAAKAGVDIAGIDACAKSSAAVELLKSDSLDASMASVSGSPTYLINDLQLENKKASSPDAVKKAICSAFQNVPAECSKTLSSASTAADGSCE